jgi:DNA-binding transcriptional MerR regulator
VLSIGELADRAGVAPSAIRYYEDLGLVAAAERVGGKRRFDPAAVDRLRVVAAAREAGFQLSEIGLLLEQDGADGRQRRELIEEKLRDVRGRIRRLQRVAAALEQAAECGCSSLEHCPIVLSRRPGPPGS